MPKEIVIQDEKAQEFLRKAIEKVKAAKDGGRGYAMALSTVVFRDVMEHFRMQEGPDGPWEMWSKAYRAHMRRVGKEGNKILQDSGRLRQAFLPTNYRKVGEGILWYNPAKAPDGDPYAYRHNEGIDTPARPFMWLSEEATEQISDVTLKFVLDN